MTGRSTRHPTLGAYSDPAYAALGAAGNPGLATGSPGGHMLLPGGALFGAGHRATSVVPIEASSLRANVMLGMCIRCYAYVFGMISCSE